MTKRDRAALHIDLFVRDSEFLHPGHGDAGERLIAFEKVDVGNAHARLFERILRRRNGAGQHPYRVGGANRQVMDARAGRETMVLHRLLAGDQQRGGGVAILAGYPCGDDAAFIDRLQ